jgi:hypothetical protein
MRGLQNSPHGTLLSPRLDGELDLKPERLTAGCALENRSRPPKVRDDFRPRVL